MDGKSCVEKMKSTVADRKTADPFFNCTLTFMEPYMQKMLHVCTYIAHPFSIVLRGALLMPIRPFIKNLFVVRVFMILICCMGCYSISGNGLG